MRVFIVFLAISFGVVGWEFLGVRSCIVRVKSNVEFGVV